MSSHDRVTSPRWIVPEQQTPSTEQSNTDMPVLPPLPPPHLVSHANINPPVMIQFRKASKSSKNIEKGVENWVEKKSERRSSYEGKESQATRKMSRRRSSYDDTMSNYSAADRQEDEDSDDEYYNHDYTDYDYSTHNERRRSSGGQLDMNQSRQASMSRDYSDANATKTQNEIRLTRPAYVKPRIPSNPNIHFKAKKSLKQKSPKRFKRACREIKPVRSGSASVTKVRIPITAIKPAYIASLPDSGYVRRDSSRPSMSHRSSIAKQRQEISSSSDDSCSTCSDSSPEYHQMERPPGRWGSRQYSIAAENTEGLLDQTHHRKHKKSRRDRDRRRSTRRRSSVTFGEMPKHVPTGIGRRVKPRFTVKKHKKHKDRDRDREGSDEEESYSSDKKKHKKKQREEDQEDDEYDDNESLLSEKKHKHKDKDSEASTKKHKDKDKKKHKQKDKDSSDDEEIYSSIKSKRKHKDKDYLEDIEVVDIERLSENELQGHSKDSRLTSDTATDEDAKKTTQSFTDDIKAATSEAAISESELKDNDRIRHQKHSEPSMSSIATTHSTIFTDVDKEIDSEKKISPTLIKFKSSKSSKTSHIYDSDEYDYEQHRDKKNSKKSKKEKKKKKRHKEDSDEISEDEDRENRYRYDSYMSPRKSILKPKVDQAPD